MKIGGLRRVSLIDYPGLISATVFLQGCNFKCPYCHNPELVDPSLFRASIKENSIMEFLESRKGKLDAVTICGGEPTIQDNLSIFIKQIKKMGFAVKLDTNGSQPHVIKTLLAEKLLDYIAMDIKAPLEKYREVIKVQVNPDAIKESIKLVLKATVPYEFRTTVIQSQLGEEDILQIAKLIYGASHYVLQKFIPSITLDKKFQKEKSFSENSLQTLKKRLEQQIPHVTVR